MVMVAGGQPNWWIMARRNSAIGFGNPAAMALAGSAVQTGDMRTGALADHDNHVTAHAARNVDCPFEPYAQSYERRHVNHGLRSWDSGAASSKSQRHGIRTPSFSPSPRSTSGPSPSAGRAERVG